MCIYKTIYVYTYNYIYEEVCGGLHITFRPRPLKSQDLPCASFIIVHLKKNDQGGLGIIDTSQTYL